MVRIILNKKDRDNNTIILIPMIIRVYLLLIYIAKRLKENTVFLTQKENKYDLNFTVGVL